MAKPDSSDAVARESTRLACAAVYGAQTSLDPVQLKKWTPNSNYGGHAFGLRGSRDKQFVEFLERRTEFLPWIRECSPIEHASSDDPPIFLLYDRPPQLGQRQKDPTHSANLGVKLQERLHDLRVDCQVAYPGAEDCPYDSMERYLIDALTSERPASR